MIFKKAEVTSGIILDSSLPNKVKIRLYFCGQEPQDNTIPRSLFGGNLKLEDGMSFYIESTPVRTGGINSIIKKGPYTLSREELQARLRAEDEETRDNKYLEEW